MQPRQRKSGEEEGIVPPSGLEVTVQQFVYTALAAAAGTVDAEQRLGRAHRQQTARRGRVREPDHAAHADRRGGHSDRLHQPVQHAGRCGRGHHGPAELKLNIDNPATTDTRR